jgi:hypothetical protein
LFLCLDTSRSFDGSQAEYFKKVLDKNHKVRWIFVLMHKPLWMDRDKNDWDKFQYLLAGRNYTVFAGHLHEYSKTVSN